MATLANPADADALLRRLARFEAASPRQWGRMSPHQAICHLSDSFKVVMGERASESVANRASRTIFSFVALHTGMPWPKGVPTGRAVDAERGGSKPIEFGHDLAELRSLVERFIATPRDFTIQPHPFFGALTDREWMVWGWRHLDHHLRQFGL
jgi:hypothetical protein